ncbi:SEL1-like repeat protein [Halobacteriovorax marinus]|nr:sel1 repeat family protein [Halobacteriovorax marinus]
MLQVFLSLILSLSISAKDLKDSCEKANANDCFEYAYEMSKRGDQLAPIIYFKKGCDLKDGKSCFALERVNQKLNQTKNSLDLLKKSCDYNFPTGCLHLARYYFKKKSYIEAVESFEKGCQLGLKSSCEEKEKYDTYFSKIIRSAAKDLSESESSDQEIYLRLLKERMSLLEKDCKAEKFESCTMLANNFLFLGNLKDARKWAETSCNNKSPYGCLALGEVEQKEEKLEFASFEKACDLDLGIGCLRFAQSIEKKNLARSMSFYRRSCQAEIGPSASSCMKYSNYQSRNPKLANKFRELGCKLDKTLCPN